MAAGWEWRASHWCRWQMYSIYHLAEFRFVLWASCTTSTLFISHLVKNFPTLPCALQNKTLNCSVWSWHFFFFSWSFPCSPLKPEVSGPIWQPPHPKPQRASGVQLLFRALYVKLKTVMPPRQFGTTLWFLTKVISTLLLLLNKWESKGFDGFHSVGWRWCLGISFQLSATQLSSLWEERPAVFALPGPCLHDPCNDLSSH